MKTLKKLICGFTDAELVETIGDIFGGTLEDLDAFLAYVHQIRTAPDREIDDAYMDYGVWFYRGKNGNMAVPVACLIQDGKRKLLNPKIANDIAYTANLKVKIRMNDCFVEQELVHTLADWTVVTVLCLSAFSPALAGNGNKPSAQAYLSYLLRLKEEDEEDLA